MISKRHHRAAILARLAIKHPWLILIIAGIITVISLGLAEHLQMRMNWSDTLPEKNPIVKSYRDVQDRFGDAAGLVVALEGETERKCSDISKRWRESVDFMSISLDNVRREY